MGFPVYLEPMCYDGVPTTFKVKAKKSNKKASTKDEIAFELSDLTSLLVRIYSIALDNRLIICSFIGLMIAMHFLNN